MMSRLSDEAVRELLLEHLDRALPAARKSQSATSPWLLTSGDAPLTRIKTLLSRRGELDDEFRRLRDGVAQGQRYPWLGLLASVMLCLLIGALLERFLLRPKGILGSLGTSGRSPDGERLTSAQVLLGATARSVGALVFLVCAIVALHVLPGLNHGGRLLASSVIWLVGGTRLFSTGIHALLLPRGGASPWPISNAVARTVAHQLGIVTAFLLLVLISRDLLVEVGAQKFFRVTVGLSVPIMLIAAILNAIFAVRRAMGERAPRTPRPGVWGMLLDRWHYLAATYVLAVLVVGMYARLVTGESMLMRALASFALLLAVPVLDYAIQTLADRLAPPAKDSVDDVPPAQGAEPAESSPLAPPADDSTGDVSPPPGAEATDQPHAEAPAPVAEQASAVAKPTPFRDALVVNFRILLALALLQTMGMLWGVRIFDVVESLFGAHLASALFQVLIASLFAFVVWRILKAALLANTPPEAEGGSDGEIGGTGLTRGQTLMPLIANTVGAALLVMLVMISLSAIGVNIAPLLAGAGVVGLAIGFGAQTLVKDIVSGVFFLVDDAFRMGEYLDIGEIRGTVERIAVRSLRLRHHRGALHTVPYGEIGHITNYSRDFAIMKFEIRVPFETDVETVRKLIKRVGIQLMENEEVAPVMLEPLKSQGVNRMDDSAFVIRCKFMTLPGKQFTVRRFAFAMIQEAFEAEGIKFAPKRVIVETTAPSGSAEALAAAAAAAQVEETPPAKPREDR